jgi:hypothetical protein
MASCARPDSPFGSAQGRRGRLSPHSILNPVVSQLGRYLESLRVEGFASGVVAS